MLVRKYIFYVVVGLLSFILTMLLLLKHFDSAVAARNSILYDKAQKAQSSFSAVLGNLVNIDSGTGYQQGLTQVENLVIEQLKSVGADVKTIDATPSVGRNILATVRGTGIGKILLLAHTDTVFQEGTAAKRPFKIIDGKAYGPGVMDDKGGILLGIKAEWH